MKSQQKRTPAKKQKPNSVDTDDLVVDTGSSTINIGPSTLSTTYVIPPTSSTTYTTSVSPTIGNITINSGSNGYTYPTWNATGVYSSSTVKITGDGLDLEEKADIKIGGTSLKEFMLKMEERLALLTARPDLEEKWEKLRDLKKQYDDMVKDIEEKQKLMDILKRD